MKRLIAFAVMAVCLMAAANSQEKAKVIAHRGYWKIEGSAQNSIRSLVKADSIKCWGSEFDVWMTSDGKLVVNHDPSYQGVEIQVSKAKQVTALKLNNGEPIPYLKDYLKTFQKHPDMKVVCELKSHKDPAQEKKAVKAVVKMMKKYGLADRVVYIAFSKAATENFVRYAPKGTEVYYLNGEIDPQGLKDMGCAGLDYSLKVMKAHPEWIKQCHDLGLKVNIWTVNKRADLQWCIDNGADFITTNEPELLQQMLK